MATVHVEFGGAMGGGAPVYTGLRASETITTSGASQAAAITAESGEYARVSALDAAVYVAVSRPAEYDPRRVVLAGASLDIGPLKAGDTINLIDAA